MAAGDHSRGREPEASLSPSAGLSARPCSRCSGAVRWGSECRAPSRDARTFSRGPGGLPVPSAWPSCFRVPTQPAEACCSSLASSHSFPHLGLGLFLRVGSSFRGWNLPLGVTGRLSFPAARSGDSEQRAGTDHSSPCLRGLGVPAGDQGWRQEEAGPADGMAQLPPSLTRGGASKPKRYQAGGPPRVVLRTHSAFTPSGQDA